jgi:fumarylacetoacetase
MPRAGFATGDQILDLTALDGLDLPDGTFAGPTLNPFIGLGREAWTAVSFTVAEVLAEGSASLVPQAEATMHLPIAVGDFVDFYSSIHHATNVGRLFRPDAEPLLPNWRHLPVGYHGRSGTLVVSGTDITRPAGQRRGVGGGPPVFGPSVALDFELEVGFVTGNANAPGQPIPIDEAEDHIFGMCLINDWSARDIQGWEYQPLGPFLGKSFATTMSPWIVPMDALTPFRVDPPPQVPDVLPYLQTEGPTGLDLQLEVAINGTTVTRTGFADMYWTMAQQLAHATANGATARAGDLFASGTVSGPAAGTLGCLLEITRNGAEPITLEDGSERRFLENGDTVVITGWCGSGDATIGFGECVGRVVG